MGSFERMPIPEGSEAESKYPAPRESDLESAVLNARVRISNAQDKFNSRGHLADWALARVARAFEERDSESFTMASDVYEIAIIEREYFSGEAHRVRFELFRLRPEIGIGHFALKGSDLDEPTTYPY